MVWEPRRTSRVEEKDVPIAIPSDERAALADNGVGPLLGKARKCVTKLFQLARERRYSVGHLFYSADLSNWHFFQFDQRDLAKRENHWEGGPHVHFINHLWPNHNAKALWASFVAETNKLSGSVYVRFIDHPADD